MWEAANEWRDLLAEEIPRSKATMTLFHEFVVSITPPKGRGSKARHYKPAHTEHALRVYEALRSDGSTAEEARQFIAKVFELPDTGDSADSTVQKMLAAGRRQRREQPVGK